MAVASASALVDTLEQNQLLAPEQLEEVKSALAPKHGEAGKALVQELVNRKWLTLFQGKQLLLGYGKSLVVGPYILLDRVGKGGVGQVFKARHRYMNRIVALKTLHADAFQDKEALQRFRREIEVASQLAHPNIVHAYEAGPIGTVLALILEYVEGVNLAQRVEKEGPLPVGLACEYIRQAAVGLQYAHERGFIHRDIKPNNLLVTKSGPKTSLEVVKILDLGLARAQEPAEGSQTHHLTVLGSGDVMQGTPDYMAPEQAIDFHTADIRSDIYSLGCTLFYLLAGHPPFPAGTLAERLLRHQQSPVPIDGLRPDLPPQLADVVRKMMAKQPEDRYQTPAEAAAALAPFCPSAASQSTETALATAAGQPNEADSSSKSTQKLSLPAQAKAVLTPPAAVSKRKLLIAGGAGGLLLLLGGVFLLSSGSGSKPEVGKTKQAQVAKPTERLRTMVFDYSRGIPATEIMTHGNALAKDNKIRLTENKGGQRGAAYFNRKLDVQAFATEFTFKLTKAEADGFTFVIQNHSANAVGDSAANLGYKNITKSVAIKFDLYGADGEDNSVGFYTKGVTPDKPFRKLGADLNLKSGHVFKARVEYDGKTLKLTLTDTETGSTTVESFDVDIPALVQGTQAWVGFTGGTGGKHALQEILSWVYQSG